MDATQPFRVFFSWQSDLPNASNTALIRLALRAAASSIESDNPQIRVDLDEATRNEPGSPNIPLTILQKIREADMLVCDVSTINGESPHKKTPNPNVVFELGYGVGQLGWGRVLLLFNKAHGTFPDDLPFDFDRHRAAAFKATGSTISNARGELTVLCKQAMQAVITSNPSRSTPSRTTDEIKRDRDIIQLDRLLSAIHLPTMDEHVTSSPHMLSDKVLFYWDEIHGIINNSSFHIYDEQMNAEIRSLYKAFHTTIKHGEMYHDTPSGLVHIFREHDLLPTERHEQVWNEIEDACRQMRDHMNCILARVRHHYLEINLDDTNARAWSRYITYRRLVTAAES